MGNAVRGKGAHLPEDVFRKNPVYKGVLAGWSWMTELRAMNDYFSPGRSSALVTATFPDVREVQGTVEDEKEG